MSGIRRAASVAGLLLGFLPGLAGWAGAQETCRLRLRLVEEETGQPLAGCVRIGGDGQWLDLAPLLSRMRGLSPDELALGWHVALPEAGVVEVPRGSHEVEAFAGIGTNRAALRLDLRGKEEHRLEIPLRRLFDPEADGWVAGNTHLHLRGLTRGEADRYLVEIARADALRVVFVSFLERALVDREYITNGHAAEDLARLSSPELVFAGGQEYRHNLGAGGEGYGHVMFLDLASRILPSSLGPGITGQGDDGTGLEPGIRRAREKGATILWCHNAFGHEDLPNWLLGHVDAQNIFDGGTRGGYRDSFYRYLNLGLRVPFSTGTDWFIYDFSRVYARLPKEGSLSADSWLEALRGGQSVITNGAWIECAVNGISPGGSVELDAPAEVTVTARATGRHPFGALEILRNGEVIHSVPAESRGEAFAAEVGQFSHRVEASSWFAARIRPDEKSKNELGQTLFAHTSPVYVPLAGRSIFDAATAASVRAEMEESMVRIREGALFRDGALIESVLEPYRRALEWLERR